MSYTIPAVSDGPRLHGDSPWGQIDYLTVIAPGIVSVSTPSHGGIWLSPARRAKVRPAWRRYARRWSGSDSWYEEDCAWACVALTFPEYFTPQDLEIARHTETRYLSKEGAA